MDIYNYKTYKHIAQDIYNILYINKEIFTITDTYILCSYSKLSQRSKDEIECLFITHNNDGINNNTSNS
jgi:hypothetical protein